MSDELPQSVGADGAGTGTPSPVPAEHGPEGRSRWQTVRGRVIVGAQAAVLAGLVVSASLPPDIPTATTFTYV